MKRNIDLTENMIFSRNSPLNHITDLNDITWRLLSGHKIPWKIDIKAVNSKDELDMDHQKKSVIALGDKKMRAEIKLLRQMDSMNYCDRCGEKLNIIPWDRQIGLCKRCAREFFINYEDRCKWRQMRDDRNIFTNIIEIGE